MKRNLINANFASTVNMHVPRKWVGLFIQQFANYKNSVLQLRMHLRELSELRSLMTEVNDTKIAVITIDFIWWIIADTILMFIQASRYTYFSLFSMSRIAVFIHSIKISRRVHTRSSPNAKFLLPN